MSGYYQTILELLKEIHDTQAEAIEQAAIAVAKSIKDGGLVHTFGSGHSAAIAYEAHGRAGGFAAVHAIIDPLRGLSEKVEGYGRALMAPVRLSPKDTTLIISNSGRNALPVEIAMIAKEQGLPVIAITSLAHSKSVSSRHSSGKRLFELADIVLDNHGGPGDAAVNLPGFDVPVGPTSTITGAFIINEVMISAAEWLLKNGIEPPIFKSANLDGSKEHNTRLRDRYNAPLRNW
jgi:uncharacterized phosphosugar-binding protein